MVQVTSLPLSLTVKYVPLALLRSRYSSLPVLPTLAYTTCQCAFALLELSLCEERGQRKNAQHSLTALPGRQFGAVLFVPIVQIDEHVWELRPSDQVCSSSYEVTHDDSSWVGCSELLECE